MGPDGRGPQPQARRRHPRLWRNRGEAAGLGARRRLAVRHTCFKPVVKKSSEKIKIARPAGHVVRSSWSMGWVWMISRVK